MKSHSNGYLGKIKSPFPQLALVVSEAVASSKAGVLMTSRPSTCWLRVKHMDVGPPGLLFHSFIIHFYFNSHPFRCLMTRTIVFQEYVTPGLVVQRLPCPEMVLDFFQLYSGLLLKRASKLLIIQDTRKESLKCHESAIDYSGGYNTFNFMFFSWQCLISTQSPS